MKFEFDTSKSESNKVKHGVDFVEIQTMWNSRTVEVPAKEVEGQFRYAVIGIFKNEHRTVIVTYRGAVTRIISARLSNDQEIKHYEQKIKKS